LRQLLSIAICHFFLQLGLSQDPVFFIDRSDKLETQLSSYAPLAFCDVNGDFRDDLVRVSNQVLSVDINVNNGERFANFFMKPLEGNPKISAVNVADLDNDSFNEIIYSGINTGIDVLSCKSIEAKVNNYQFISLSNLSHFAQGSCLHDINKDGKIDFLYSNDVGENIIFINDDNNNLSQENLIDFTTALPSDNSGNYSSIWFDADQDEDLDLFIAKCRSTAKEPTDPRRINMLYINEGDSFREAALEFGLASGVQSWAADSGDLDNDGDIDLLIINHGAPHVIMENNGHGLFIEHLLKSEEGDTLTGNEIQTSLVDMNNDGWLDIIIAGSNDYILLNKGDLEFSYNEYPFGVRNAFSFAYGDINADGYLDVCLNYGSPGGLQDELWQNLGGTNNYVSFSLHGTQSNSNGVGAQIKIYGDWGVQTRWLKSGVAYGITNSLNVHFGVDDATIIDSISVLWPSGLKENYENIITNRHYILAEDECFEESLQILPIDTIRCIGEELVIENASSFRWSNGNVSPIYIIEEAELIYAESVNMNCPNRSELLQVYCCLFQEKSKNVLIKN